MGHSYTDYLEDPDLYNRVKRHDPDIVFVVLAGNAIRNNVTNVEICTLATRFYNKLRATFPNTQIVSAQIEKRWYREGNRWNCPAEVEFQRRRVALHNFYRRLRLKNYTLLVAGRNRLDNRTYYRDEVHLNQAGLQFYAQMVRNTVSYIIIDLTKKAEK